MMWGGFGYEDVGGFHKIENRMDAKQYRDIVKFVGIPSARNLLGDGFVWQQDNDPKHTSLLLQEFFEDAEEKGFCELLPWPSYSADLNPTKNLWHRVDREAKERACNTIPELLTSLHAAWEKVPLDYLRGLIDSMPRRIYTVIKAWGGNTKYRAGIPHF